MSQTPRVLNLWRHVPNFTHDWNYKRDGLPPGAVYIGRKYGLYGLPESKWHNPYKVRRHTREEHQRVVDEFERYLHESGLVAGARHALHHARRRRTNNAADGGGIEFVG